MPYEACRFAMIVCGKACALSVLMMSLSNQFSIVTGLDYMNLFSFGICGIVAVAFCLLIRHISTHRARLVLAGIVFALVLAWCLLVVYLKWFEPIAYVPSELVMLFYAAAGRIATLFLNIQWNFHYSLNEVGESARSALVAVAIALVLFLVSTTVGNDVATVFLVAALVTSGVLSIAVEFAGERVARSDHSVQAVERRDAKAAVSAESHFRTRILYFGARVLYGMALGFMVSAVAAYPPTGVSFAPVALMMAAIVAIGLIGMWLYFPSGKGSLFLVAQAPVFVALACGICFYSEGLSDMGLIFAMLGEVTWTIQNLYQLPSYRRMTGMRATHFAYYEYAAQVVPFYFTAWFVSSNLAGLGIVEGSELPGSIGLVVLLVLMGYSIGAAIWHTTRYHPIRVTGVSAGPSVSDGETGMPSSALSLLTPREQEVFGMLAEGYSRPYIAKMLYISVDTVKVHVKHIYAKLGIGSQDDLIRIARGEAATKR